MSSENKDSKPQHGAYFEEENGNDENLKENSKFSASRQNLAKGSSSHASRSGNRDHEVDDVIAILNDESRSSKSNNSFHSPTSDYSRHTNSPRRVFSIIYSLQKSRQENMGNGDEWHDDDDSGYISVKLTEEEFYDFEEESERRLILQREQQYQQRQQQHQPIYEDEDELNNEGDGDSYINQTNLAVHGGDEVYEEYDSFNQDLEDSEDALKQLDLNVKSSKAVKDHNDSFSNQLPTNTSDNEEDDFAPNMINITTNTNDISDDSITATNTDIKANNSGVVSDHTPQQQRQQRSPIQQYHASIPINEDEEHDKNSVVDVAVAATGVTSNNIIVTSNNNTNGSDNNGNNEHNVSLDNCNLSVISQEQQIISNNDIDVTFYTANSPKNNDHNIVNDYTTSSPIELSNNNAQVLVSKEDQTNSSNSISPITQQDIASSNEHGDNRNNQHNKRINNSIHDTNSNSNDSIPSIVVEDSINNNQHHNDKSNLRVNVNSNNNDNNNSNNNVNNSILSEGSFSPMIGSAKPNSATKQQQQQHHNQTSNISDFNNNKNNNVNISSNKNVNNQHQQRHHHQQQQDRKPIKIGDQRGSDIWGQQRFQGADGVHCYFNLKIIFEPYKTGFEDTKELQHTKGTIIAGRYQVEEVLGQAAFSTALQCVDLAVANNDNNEEQDENGHIINNNNNDSPWVCLKVIKNNKDFFDQSMDEIKLLQYINSRGDPDQYHVLRLIDYFYFKEHLFIVTELLKENLYEFGRFIRENDHEPYYTIPRLKRIMKQLLEALQFIHSLGLIHCDIKPENIVIKSFSRCEIKLIDYGSSCFTTDHLTTYIQSRSYRAPEVILGHRYDTRIDIWSVGAVLAEAYTGYVLFQNDSVPTMLSRITGILGPFPEHVLRRGRDTGKYFTISNIVYEKEEADEQRGIGRSYQLIFPKVTTLKSRLHIPVNEYGECLNSEDEIFVDFVAQLLHLDPNRRLTADQALQHPFLADADTVYFSEYIIGTKAQHSNNNRNNSGSNNAQRHHNHNNGDFQPPPLPHHDADNEEDDDDEGDFVSMNDSIDDEGDNEGHQHPFNNNSHKYRHQHDNEAFDSFMAYEQHLRENDEEDDDDEDNGGYENDDNEDDNNEDDDDNSEEEDHKNSLRFAQKMKQLMEMTDLNELDNVEDVELLQELYEQYTLEMERQKHLNEDYDNNNEDDEEEEEGEEEDEDDDENNNDEEEEFRSQEDDDENNNEENEQNEGNNEEEGDESNENDNGDNEVVEKI